MSKLSEYRSPNDAGGQHNCNTIACFGGWIPAMPEFAAMGVTSSGDQGVPMLGGWMGSGVAAELFNKETLFAPRNNTLGSFKCDYDDTAKSGISDHELVTHRLKEHIKYLESVE